MSTKIFKIIQDYYDKDDYIFLKDSVTFHSGINILVGCNGAGKTTLLNILDEQIRDEDDLEPVVLYSDVINGRGLATSRYLYKEEYDKVASSGFMNSEGENVVDNLFHIMVQEVGAMVRRNVVKDKKVYLLLDGIDSGLSINALDYINNDVFKQLQKVTAKDGVDLYIIATANSYELTLNNYCIDTIRLEPITFTDYNDYADFIRNSYQQTLKRRNPYKY